MNLDASRVGTSKAIPAGLSQGKKKVVYGGGYGLDSKDNSGQNPNIGRFPANLVVHVTVIGAFPDVVGATGKTASHTKGHVFGFCGTSAVIYQDSTLSASRFFKNLVK